MKPEKSPGFCSHPERRERVSWLILWDGLVFLRIFAWIVKFWCLVWLQLSSECLLTHARTCISSAGVQWSQLYLCLQILWARHWQPSSGCPTAPELHVTIIIIKNNFYFFNLFSSVSCASNFISRKYPPASVGCLCPACARNSSSPVVCCSIWGCSRGLYSSPLLPFPICFSPPWLICPSHHSQHGSTTWSCWRRDF